MNLKLKAVLILVGILGAGVVGGMLVQTFALVLGPELILTVVIGAIMIFLLYQMYCLILYKLESDIKLDNLNKGK
jgi:hypothetical protein